jgi:glycosyltransferase involved in cell wall biosynthesis
MFEAKPLVRKVLQVNVVYKKGSTGKIVYDIHSKLKEVGIDSVICYGRGEVYREKGVYKCAPELIMKIQSLRSKLTGYSFSGCIISTSKLIKIIKNEKPDIVHLHNLNGYFVNIYRLLKYLKGNSIPTVLTLHAEFMYTGGCGYALDCEKWLTGCGNCPQKNGGRPSSKLFDRSAQEWFSMKKAFDKFDKLAITSVSDWVTGRAKYAPILSNKNIVTVENGLDTGVYKCLDYDDIKEKHCIRDERIILHVTPDFLNPIKGGQHIIELAKRFLSENIKIIIVGFNGDISNLPANIIPVNHTKDQKELAKYYSMAELTVLTSKKETFSMVCAESLSCGTPVVGYKAGAPENIAIREFSEFVDQEDIDMLESTVRKWLDKKQGLSNEISEKAKIKYSKEQMAKKYLDVYSVLLYGRSF